MSLEADRADLLRAARGGLCGVCALSKLVKSSKGSVFVMCTHPDLPKYQGQPVLRCGGFVGLERVSGSDSLA